jgi:hypothetical protein
MKVAVLAITFVNWAGFTNFIKDTFNKSPTRILDKNDLALDSPLAFLASLQGLTRELNPWKDTFDNHLLNHLNITVGVYCDIVQGEKLLNDIPLIKKSLIEKDRANCVLILSGTVLEWKLALTLMPELSEILTIFRGTDLRNLFIDI